jgi:thioesterase domain-containing protein
MKKHLEKYLHQNIPLSQAMGIQVEEASAVKIILKAPLTPNINHKKTVFGGSLHAAATLACWSLLHLNLKELQDVQIVIAKSEVNFQAPVLGDFTAECLLPEKKIWERFLKVLEAKSKAPIHLLAHIRSSEQICVAYHGVFVVLKNAS